MPARRFNPWILVAVDVLLLLIVSFTGYLTHYYGKEPFSFRWLSTFLPLTFAWLLAACLGGLFRREIAGSPHQAFWRSLAAGALAAPLALTLRGLYLDSAVSTIFALVMVGMTAACLMVWRVLWALLYTKTKSDG